jgi:hypothetical protein
MVGTSAKPRLRAANRRACPAITLPLASIAIGASSSSAKRLTRPRCAETFLLDTLRVGPRPTLEVEDLARLQGISRRSLTRARAVMRVIARKQGLNAGWVLALPEKNAASTEESRPMKAAEIEPRQASAQIQIWRCNLCRDTCPTCREKGPARCGYCYK